MGVNENPFVSFQPSDVPATSAVAASSYHRSADDEPDVVHEDVGWFSIYRKMKSSLYRWLTDSRPRDVKAYRPVQTSYVKLDIMLSSYDYGRCHGSLVADNVVLTASHCMPDDWRKIVVHYGSDFSHTATVNRKEAQPNWARVHVEKTRQVAEKPDLALFQLPVSVGEEEGATIAQIPDQDSCEDSRGPAQAFRSVGMWGDEMGIQHTTISNMRSHKRWGQTLRGKGEIAVLGDSGSPLMSPKGKQIGVVAGFEVTADGEVTSHAVALCKYAEAVRAQVDKFGVVEPDQQLLA